MDCNRMPVIVSRDIPADEAWIILRADAPELPANLKGKVSVPCVVTGDLKSFRDALKLLGLATRCKQLRRRLRLSRRKAGESSRT
jgi:hypothetical protein